MYQKNIRMYGGGRLLLLNYLFMFVTALDGVVIPSIIASLISAIEKNNMTLLFKYSIIGMIAYCFIRTGLYLWQVYKQKLILNFNYSIKKNITEKVFIDDYEMDNDALFSLITNDLKLLETNYIGSFLNFIYCIGFSFISCIFVLIVDYKLGLLFIICSVFPIVIPKFFRKKVQCSTEKWTSMSSIFLKTLRENLEGNFVIKLFDREKIFFNKLMNVLNNVENMYYRMNKLLYTSRWCADITSGLSTFVPLMIGGYFVIKGNISLSQLMAVYLASDRIISPLVNGIDHYTRMKSTEVISNRVFDIITNENSEDKNHRIDEIFPIEAKSLSLNYGDNVVFKNIDFTINRGDKILLKGDSGTGKSSFLKIMMGYEKFYKGKVTFAGSDISKIKSKMRNKKIGYFSQSPFLFDDSIKNNITLGKRYPDEVIEAVVKKVKLTHLIDEKGIDFNIGVKGEKLSGGQNARVALARILLEGYDLLLLDEFSSSLDKNTHEDIRSIIFDEYESIIEVSHSDDIYNSGFNKIMNINKLSIDVRMPGSSLNERSSCNL